MDRVLPNRSLILAAVLPGLVILGPDWPARATELVCGETAGRMHVREVLVDMDACTVAMDREADAGNHCFCSVRQTWLAPLSYVSMVIFWATASAIFGAFAGRVKSFGLLLVLAAVFVAATIVFVQLVVPLFGWRLLLEGL